MLTLTASYLMTTINNGNTGNNCNISDNDNNISSNSYSSVNDSDETRRISDKSASFTRTKRNSKASKTK